MYIYNSYKSFPLVVFESIAVGSGLICLFIILLFLIGLLPYFNINHIDDEFKKRHSIHMFLTTFLAGALFHLLCEYSGINVWYVNQYNKLLPKNKLIN
jgi:hypothetical protein